MAKTKDKEIEIQEFKQSEPVNEYRFDSKNHIHFFREKPLCGTSSVLSVVAKPLTWWASGLACMKFGWLDPKKNDPQTVQNALEEGFSRVQALSIEDYSKLLGEAYKAHQTSLKDSANKGTDLHAELERFVKNTMENRMATYDEKIMPFIKWANENVKRFLWSEMYCFSEKHWLGGITDCAVELNDGRYGIIDFKSSKDAYDSQFWQIAGYDIQVSENGGYTENGEQVFKLDKPIEFYAIVPFGAEIVEPKFHYDVEGDKEAFLSALVLYKKLNK